MTCFSSCTSCTRRQGSRVGSAGAAGGATPPSSLDDFEFDAFDVAPFAFRSCILPPSSSGDDPFGVVAVFVFPRATSAERSTAVVKLLVCSCGGGAPVEMELNAAASTTPTHPVEVVASGPGGPPVEDDEQDADSADDLLAGANDCSASCSRCGGCPPADGSAPFGGLKGCSNSRELLLLMLPKLLAALGDPMLKYCAFDEELVVVPGSGGGPSAALAVACVLAEVPDPGTCCTAAPIPPSAASAEGLFPLISSWISCEKSTILVCKNLLGCDS